MPTLPNYIASNLDDSISEYLTGAGSSVPSWVLPGASVDLNFANGQYFGGTLASLLSITRASNATDLLPSSASGYAYNTYSSNVLAISPTFGLLIFEARTNLLLNSTAPATQTTASLGTGTYTLWGNGSGSVLASGGTATITGAASATNGSPNTFTVTVAGTVTVTITGSLNAFQLELGAFGTSFIVTAGATATRAADSIQIIGALDSALRGAQGVLYIQTLSLFAVGINSRFIGDNGGTELIGRGSGGANALVTYNGGVQLVGATPANWTALRKSGVRWTAAPARSLVLGGGSITSDANAKNIQTTYYLGATNGSAECINGAIGRVSVGTVAPSDGVFQGNTT